MKTRNRIHPTGVNDRSSVTQSKEDSVFTPASMLNEDDIIYYADQIAKGYEETKETALALQKSAVVLKEQVAAIMFPMPPDILEGAAATTVEVEYDGNSNKIVTSHPEDEQDENSSDGTATSIKVDSVVIVPQPKKPKKQAEFPIISPSPKRRRSKFMSWRKSKSPGVEF